LEKHQDALYAQYQQDMRTFERARKKDKDAEPPAPPLRYVTWNTTCEKLGEIVARSAKGLLMKSDEIAGWMAA
jgi:hypothetical protein